MSVTLNMKKLSGAEVDTLVQGICAKFDLDFEKVVKEFGVEKKAKQMKVVPLENRCMARLWNDGKGGQCTRQKGKGPDGDLCGNHARCLSEKGVLPQGRMDEPVPDNMKKTADVSVEPSVSSIVEPIVEESQEPPVEKGVIEKVPGVENDTNVTHVDLEPATESELPIEAMEEADCLAKEEAKKAKEEEKKAKEEAKKKAKEEAKKAKEEAKKAKEEEKKAKEDAKKAKEEAKKKDVDEEEGEDEEEEICCKELEYNGKTYLLDPESNKVYENGGENDFVGKYDGEVIDFEAIDSDSD